MATITSETTDPPSSQLPQRDAQPRNDNPPPRNLPAIYQWVIGLVVVVAILMVSLAFWGPDMDFPSEINQIQDDGSQKSVQISRLISTKIKVGTTWLVRNWGGMFNGIDALITYTMVALEDGLRWIPWPATFAAVIALSFILGSWRLALLALVSLVFIGAMNRWDSAVETIAIILFSVTVSVFIAMPLGIYGARSNRFDSIMRPILDGMQTMPTYVYLVPGILFFGLGYTPAVIATVIYAVPPATGIPRKRSRNISRTVAPKGADAHGHAHDHGRHKSDDYARALHGRNRLTGRSQRTRRRCVPSLAAAGPRQQRDRGYVHRFDRNRH